MCSLGSLKVKGDSCLFAVALLDSTVKVFINILKVVEREEEEEGGVVLEYHHPSSSSPPSRLYIAESSLYMCAIG